MSLIPAHRGDGYTTSDRRVLLHGGTRGNHGAALCRLHKSMWLDYLKGKKIRLDVKDVLVHFVMGDRD